MTPSSLSDGLIIDHSVHIGNPADIELLRPAIERVTTHLGVVPSLVAADRGYWDSTASSIRLIGAAGRSALWCLLLRARRNPR
jgi:hypothetical protein